MMKNIAIIFIILGLTACKAVIYEDSRNEVYGLKACQAFTALQQSVTELILSKKFSQENIEKFEKVKDVAEPYCLSGDFSEKATAEYVTNAVIETVLLTKGE